MVRSIYQTCVSTERIVNPTSRGFVKKRIQSFTQYEIASVSHWISCRGAVIQACITVCEKFTWRLKMAWSDFRINRQEKSAVLLPRLCIIFHVRKWLLFKMQPFSYSTLKPLILSQMHLDPLFTSSIAEVFFFF